MLLVCRVIKLCTAAHLSQHTGGGKLHCVYERSSEEKKTILLSVVLCALCGSLHGCIGSESTKWNQINAALFVNSTCD